MLGGSNRPELLMASSIHPRFHDAKTMAGPQFQARFFTKQEKYAVPSHPFSLPATATPQDLNAFINALLSENREDEELQQVDFDFLVSKELLKLSLREHLDEKGISSEHVLEIEFLERYPAPTPFESLHHDDWVSGVQSNENWIITSCYDNTVHIWSTTGEHKLMIPSHTDPATAVAWIEVGDEICTFASTSHDETIAIWQWNSKTNAVECVNVCRGHSRSVNCIDVKVHQQKFATGSFDCTVKVWSTEVLGETDMEIDNDPEGTRKKVKTESGKTKNKSAILTLTGHKSSVSGIQWTGDNEVCSASMDDTIKIWDVELGGMKSQLIGSKAFLGVSYSELSRLLISASADRYVRLWDPRSKEGTLVKCVFTSHNQWVTSVNWSPNDEHLFVSASHDALVKLWDTRSPKAPLYDMTGHEDRVLCVDWSVPNMVVSGGCDNQVKIFETQNRLQ